MSPQVPSSRPSAPDALLRLWMAAEIGIAALYVWQGALLADWPADMAAPKPLPAVTLIEFMYLFLFIPAAVVVAMRWHAARDRVLAGLALAYGLASVGSLAAWSAADTTGMVQTLYWLDAVISLGGVPVALRALRLR